MDIEMVASSWKENKALFQTKENLTGIGCWTARLYLTILIENVLTKKAGIWIAPLLLRSTRVDSVLPDPDVEPCLRRLATNASSDSPVTKRSILAAAPVKATPLTQQKSGTLTPRCKENERNYENRIGERQGIQGGWINCLCPFNELMRCIKKGQERGKVAETNCLSQHWQSSCFLGRYQYTCIKSVVNE